MSLNRLRVMVLFCVIQWLSIGWCHGCGVFIRFRVGFCVRRFFSLEPARALGLRFGFLFKLALPFSKRVLISGDGFSLQFGWSSWGA